MLSRQKRRTKDQHKTRRVLENEPSHDHHVSPYHNAFHLNHPMIYSAPTVDTLGDDVASIHPYATPRPLPQTASASGATSSTVTDTTNTNRETTQVHSSSMWMTHKKVSTRRRRLPRHPKSENEFQKSEDAMSVSIRNIPVAERSAFDLQPAPSMSELLSSRRSVKKTSPSPLHLHLIHKLQSMHHLHQLAFSPSVGTSSDVLYPRESDKQRRKRRSTTSLPLHPSDGRYTSIDPVQATLSALPATPPLLSNKRHRLPMRADVGFPNASSDEIQRKQAEINQETEWEEASPRLIVLVTSDDLGTAAIDPSNQDGAILTFAGPELLAAKWQNQQHFSKHKGTKSRVPATADRYSVLAPPLDSIYSSTAGWRPRPFHDRPPGLRYTLVSPIKLEFGVGNIEPLVCSLSLYRLGSGDVLGKASEEFYFPAGDWKGKLKINALKDSIDLTEQWLKRKHKALFALDPLVVPTEELHVVLQVYTVTHWESATAYLMGKPIGDSLTQEDPPKDKKSWKKRLKVQFHKGKASPEAHTQRASYRASAVFDTYGTQFLSPLCFGVTPLHQSNSEEYNWPVGKCHDNVVLYTYPSSTESQEDFVKRLCKLVAPINSFSNIVGNNNAASSTDESLSTTASLSSIPGDASTMSNRRKGLGRFVSPKKTPKKQVQDDQTTSIATTATIPAKVSLFISDLNADFLDSMLQTPPELSEGNSTMPALPTNIEPIVLPKLLVDVSGSCAIMMDPTKAATVNDANKRSNLVRLPPTPNGYMEASDFREVWFLPPMPPKQHYVDAPPSYRSLINLLYLYPRLLRLSGATDNKSSFRRASKVSLTRYSVRVSLVEHTSEAKQDSGTVEGHPKVLSSFHNPAPWAGPSFVKSVFTKIPGDVKSDDMKTGMPLNDEFKLRLPAILDGNQFLRFTLCAVEFSDDLDDSVSVEQTSADDSCGVFFKEIAEATIPLSSHSTRDPVSGQKVTTIIPNGCHRLKLGDFQFQVETRLLSSIHVNDSCLATALRYFPLALNEDPEAKDAELALAKHQASTPERIVFSSLFATAEPTAILSHFPALLYMHLANFVKTTQSSKVTNERLLIDCMDSLLEVCCKAREVIIVTARKSGKDRLRAFIKSVVDAFDETYFHSSGLNEAAPDDDTASDIVPVGISESVDPSGSGEEQDDDDFDGGAIRKRRKDSFRSEIDTRISRTFSAMESPNVSFLRTAYGATKTDRMRLEAELKSSAGRLTHLVDDDETVVTFATGYSGEARMAEAREAFERSKTPKAKDQVTVNSIEDHDTTTAPSHDFTYRSISEMGLAKRVRSAAKVMLAPCVPPSFFNPSPRNSTSWQEEKTPVDEGEVAVIREENSEHPYRIIAIAGSDLENDTGSVNDLSDEVANLVSPSTSAALRFPWHCPILRLSIQFESLKSNGAVSVDRTDFVYEAVLLLWLRSISEHETSQGLLRGSVTMTTHDDDKISREPFHKFYRNMDILLSLCLKSLALRFGQVTKISDSPVTRVLVDKNHMALFESFFEMIPLILMKEAMAGLQSPRDESSLHHILAKADHLIDFLIGLYTMLHPAQTSVLTKKLFQSLRHAETQGVEMENGDPTFEWTPENLHRVKCSRQLRLRVVEKLSVLPNFVALNYPMRFPSRKLSARANSATWTSQHAETLKDIPLRLQDLLNDGEYLLPPSGWLAEILTRESLSISSLSCEAVVAEAMAHLEEKEPKSTAPVKSVLKTRPTAALTRDDLLMFQSIAIHGITCVHELLLRRHAMDRRYQTDSTRERIASLFAIPIFEKSLASVRWLARMESTHRVRSLWLLCFTYVLQEAPENLLREAVSSYSNSREVQIHRFIRLLRLSSSTFQSFIDQQRYCMFPSEIDSGISPWLLQESFNTICATTIIVVEECASPTSTSLMDQKKMIQGILDLLLHILTTPQSSVTHLRAVGGAIQALERFGAAMFLEITGGSLQHWIRVVAGLMNSIALSVRSIAVDFVVSLFGSTFDLYGSIDELAIIFATVLPEVAAREIGLCSVSGHIMSLEHAETAIWPLRRSFADLEDANPLDDDRVDPQLSPMLSHFCRACQAILDGVLIEMRLEGNNIDVVGTKLQAKPLEMYTFDADEESLFEAANYFLPESAPVQRIRWLMTLKCLHQAKEQWVEAAECLIMCARAIAESIPHLKTVWRPSRFPLWSDSRRSLWLSTVGEDLGIPERGNEQVMSFADKFLEPDQFERLFPSLNESGKLNQPSLAGMSKLLTDAAKEAVAMYDKEGEMDGLAYSRLESLLVILMEVLECHGTTGAGLVRGKSGETINRRQHVEEEASLRRVIASISGDMTKLAERLLFLTESASPCSVPQASSMSSQHFFVRVVISGTKPTRFIESTTLPTFLEWGIPCICRVPKAVVEKAMGSVGPTSDRFEEVVCSLVGKPIRKALLRDGIPSTSIVFRLGNQSPSENDRLDAVIVDIGFVQMNFTGRREGVDRARIASHQHKRDDLIGSSRFDGRNLLSKQFIYRKPPGASEVISSTFVEVTVANPFPCPLSRQRSLLTSQYVSNK